MGQGQQNKSQSDREASEPWAGLLGSLWFALGIAGGPVQMEGQGCFRPTGQSPHELSGQLRNRGVPALGVGPPSPSFPQGGWKHHLPNLSIWKMRGRGERCGAVPEDSPSSEQELLTCPASVPRATGVPLPQLAWLCLWTWDKGVSQTEAAGDQESYSSISMPPLGGLGNQNYLYLRPNQLGLDRRHSLLRPRPGSVLQPLPPPSSPLPRRPSPHSAHPGANRPHPPLSTAPAVWTKAFRAGPRALTQALSPFLMLKKWETEACRGRVLPKTTQPSTGLWLLG